MRRLSAPPPAQASLNVVNLHNGLAELAALFLVSLANDSWLDCYLSAAGMHQLVDDHRESDPLGLRRAAAFLRRDGRAAGAFISSACLTPGARALDRLRMIVPQSAAVRRLGEALAGALPYLADLVVEGEARTPFSTTLERLAECCESIHASPAQLPTGLRDELIRLPACFRGFDQHPDDLGRLVRSFAAEHPNRSTPILVVGVRTSGSYLAPLYGAHLRTQGYASVDTLTMRPMRTPTRETRGRVRALIANGGLALICDDPPETGGAIERIAQALQRMGVPAARIVALLALFGDTVELPPALRGLQAVLLPHDDWSIHDRMHPSAVQAADRPPARSGP